MDYPISVSALSVRQNIGNYYVVVLSARVLLDVCYSDALHATLREGGLGYDLRGTQRNLDHARLKDIGEFIDRPDSAFPNSIILAPNFREEDGLVEEEVDEAAQANKESKRWYIDIDKNGVSRLNIPTNKRMTAIIDGQHRLFAFAYAEAENLDTQLICSVFLDLPKPIQAQIFATINSTQKPVPKSLTYELFGYNIEAEAEDYWSPDKLAVFLTRKLGTDPKSPLKGKIIVSSLRDPALEELADQQGWKVSTAVVVEGFIRLISSNPKKDTNDLLRKPRKKRLQISNERVDKSPLRRAYLNNEDVVIYTLVLNYLIACEKVFWHRVISDSFIVKTVGLQALFDILRDIASECYEQRNIKVERFIGLLSPASDIDFSTELFRNASGAGRTIIKKAIRSKIGL